MATVTFAIKEKRPYVSSGGLVREVFCPVGKQAMVLAHHHDEED